MIKYTVILDGHKTVMTDRRTFSDIKTDFTVVRHLLHKYRT